jgi:hypothetical protein
MTTKAMTEADTYGWHSRTIVGSDGEETLSQVKDAPSHPDGHLSEQQEARLFEHYGISARPVLNPGSAALKRSSRTPIAQHPKPTGSRDNK